MSEFDHVDTFAPISNNPRFVRGFSPGVLPSRGGAGASVDKPEPSVKRIIGGILIGAAVAGAGCQPSQQEYPPSAAPKVQPQPQPQPPTMGAAPSGVATPSGQTLTNKAVAEVDGVAIGEADLWKVLVEAHGFNALMYMVQLELAKKTAANQKIVVTEKDIQEERDRTHSRLFEDLDEQANERIEEARKANKPVEVAKLQKQLEAEHQRLMAQFLQQQNITPVEWDLVLRTNAYLRKLAEPQIEPRITDEVLKTEFSIKYKEKVRVRHIQLNRPQEVFEARRRLAAGEPFEKVATELSTNRQTAPLGGEIPPFAREDTRLPANFKEAAFALKPGEISEMVEADDSYHLIQVIERIEPNREVVQFDQVKVSLRADLRTRLATQMMMAIREEIGQLAREKLTIYEPSIRKQWLAKLDERERLRKEDEANRMRMQNDRELRKKIMEAERAATRPATTQPGALPGTTQPAVPVTPAAPATPAAPTPGTPTAPAAPSTTPGAQAAPTPAAPAASAPEAALPPATRPAATAAGR